MGYRLNIEDKENNLSFYGTKLYGYVNDERELRSYKYLMELGKVTERQAVFEEWDYPWRNDIILNSTQFAEFIRLYLIDLCEKGFFKTYRIWESDAKTLEWIDNMILFDKLKNTKSEKHLWWD